MIIYNYITTNLLNNKKYVGMHSTDNIDDNYLGSGMALLNAVKKHGKENFIREMLCVCKTKEEAFKNEAIFIKEYNTLKPNGYNISPTGGLRVPGCHSREGLKRMSAAHKGKTSPMKGKKHSKEAIRRMSESSMGRVVSKETREKMSKSSMGCVAWHKGLTKETDERVMKMSEAKKGMFVSIETRKKQSKSRMGEKNHMYGKKGELSPNYGKTFSGEHRRKISEAATGRQHTEETKNKLSVFYSKPILQYTKHGVFLKEWPSAKVAAGGNETTRTGISACCRGVSKTAYGHVWKFKEIKK